MSENAKESSTSDKPVPASDSKKLANNSQPVKTANGRGLAVFSLFISLLVLAGLGGIGWYGYQAQQQLVVLQQQTTAAYEGEQNLQQETAGLSRQLQQLKSEQQSLQALPEALNQQHEQMSVVLDRVDSLSRKLKELQGSNRENWLLAEAEYLMRLANQRLRTEGDVKSAETLLLDADQLLVSVDDYSLFAVREALAEDIAAVRAVPALDRDGLWLQLSALEKQIDMLPIVPEINSAPERQIETPTQAAPAIASGSIEQSQFTIWKDKIIGTLEHSWKVFSSQFRITRRDAPVEPLPTLEDEIALRLNARLMLQQARLALLQGRQEVYSNSLGQVREWVDRHFSFDQQGSQSVLDQLKTLQDISVEQRMPDISHGLSRLKVYLDDLSGDRRLPLQAAGAQQAKTEESTDKPQETVDEGEK